MHCGKMQNSCMLNLLVQHVIIELENVYLWQIAKLSGFRFDINNCASLSSLGSYRTKGYHHHLRHHYHYDVACVEAIYSCLPLET